MSRFIDLTDQHFGRLLVVGRAENDQYGRARWNCKCDCGIAKIVAGYQLRGGYIQSCGCLQKERASEASKKHNVFRVYGDIVYVTMSNSDNEMIVDKDVWEWAKNYCWYESHGYATTNMLMDDGTIKRVRLHVYVFSDCPVGRVRDHINGNRLDNRRDNIRFVTTQQNNHNHGKSKMNTSGHTGVSWDVDRKKWFARIKIDNKHINLGRFSNLQDAIAAREVAEVKYFGEYRRKK